MATVNDWNGAFLGRSNISRSGELGGAKDVFVKLGGSRNEFVFPAFGGRVMNPFKGTAKLYAGDLAEYRTNENGVEPEYWILKTFKVVSVASSGKVVNIERDGYKHIPFAGDVLTIAPNKIGGSGEAMTVASVAKAEVDGKKVWTLTMASAPTTAATAGAVLVECDSTGTMLVKNINSVCPCDYDFRFSEVNDPESDYDYSKADYKLTLALGGLMYTSKMSPMPKCVLDLNTSKVNGWFEIGGLVSTH